MKRILRIMMLLAAMIITAGQPAWAKDITINLGEGRGTATFSEASLVFSKCEALEVGFSFDIPLEVMNQSKTYGGVVMQNYETTLDNGVTVDGTLTGEIVAIAAQTYTYTVTKNEMTRRPVGASTALTRSGDSDAVEIATWSGFRKGACSFTFDDGAPSHVIDAGPLFKKYGYKATFNLVVNWNPNWSGFQGLADEGHEIASHSNSHGQNMSGEEASSKKSIEGKIQQKYGVITVAYPNCNVPNKDAVKQNYVIGRICNGSWQSQPDMMGKDGPSDWTMASAIMTGSTGTNDFKGNMQKAVQQGGWIAFLTHGFEGKNNGSATYSPTPIGSIEDGLKWAQQNDKDIWVAPMGHVAMYIKERKASKVEITASTASLMTIQLKHTIADNISKYDYPLSLRVKSDWEKAEVTQDGAKLENKIDGGYIYFDAIPNGGDIVVKNESASKICYEHHAGDGGLLICYANADDASAYNMDNVINFVQDANNPEKYTYHPINAMLTNGIVYIRTRPDFGYTGLGATISAEKTTGSGDAQARLRAPGVGQTIEVTAVSGHPGVYQFTMPDDGSNVSLSAQFSEPAQQQVSYVDENYQTRTSSAIVLDETMATLDATKVYVVPDGLTINHDIGCVSSSGALTIIVPDGKTLSLNTVDISDNQGQFANAGFHMDCGLSFYGQANATGKVVIHTKKESIGMNGALTVAHLNMEAACSAENAIKAAGGVVFAGHQTKGNSLTVRSAGTGYSAAITGGGSPVTIKNSDVEVTGYAKSNGEYVGCSGSGILGGGTTGVTITGLADGSNTVKIRTQTGNSSFGGIYCSDAPVTITNCDVDIIQSGFGESKGIFGGKGVTITGLASGNKVNKLTVRSDGYGITTSSSLISINYCDVEVTGVNQNNGEYDGCTQNGLRTNADGINITGRADGSNKVVVRSKGNGGIYAYGCPLNIKYCDVDVFTNGRSAYAIFAGGTSGVNIEGVATGNKLNKITVRSASNGIYGGGGNVSISYCDVEVTNTTKNADGDYDFCSNSGINAAGGGSTGVTMIGRADGSNKVTVRSVGNAIYGAGQPVTIKYYDVEVFSNGSGVRSDGYDLYLEGVATGNKVNKITVHSDNSSYGGSIYSSGGFCTVKYYDVEVTGAGKNAAGEYNPCGNVGLQATNNGLILIGRDNVGNKISVRSNYNALNASGTFIDIKNYDVDVVSTNSYGLLGSSDDGVSIASTLENGNTIKVKSGGPGLFSSGTGLNITNCTVDVESARTAIVASRHTASNTEINTNINIIDSKLTVTCTGVYEGSYASEYCGIIAPAGLTIDGSQVTVSAPKGYAGIYAYRDGSETIADKLKYVTFSWKNTTDFIMVDNYQLEEGYTLNIAEGKVFKYTSGNTVNRLMGTVTDLDAIANKELTPYGVGGYCGKDDETTTTVDESKNVTWEIPFVKDNSGNTVLGSTLAINGTGAMADYTGYSTSGPDNFAPWIVPDHSHSFYSSGGLKYPSVTAVTIGSGVTTIGSDAFIYCPGITDVTIGTDVTTLGADALQSCLDLKNVTFAEGSQLTTIDNYAFGNCISLTAIDIPVGVTTIGKGAFSDCSGLTGITIPDGVTAIDMNTFMHCSNLSDVTIGSGVTTIGACAFERCTSLTAITIPANVTTIYEYAFVTCPSLETMTIERYDSNTATNGGNPITTIDSSTFMECEALKLILVPSEDAYDAYSKADDGWTGDVNDDGTGKTYKSMLAPNEIELTKSASGWSTFCHNYLVSYSLSDGNSGNDAPKAYTLSGLSSDGKSVDITAATDNHVAPATPLLLGYKAPANNNDLLTLTAVPATATTPATSVIVDNGGTDVVFYGNTGNTALDATALTGGTTTYIYLFGNTEGRQSYVLSQGKFIPVISTDGGIAPHRCWLNVKGTAAARELSIGDGETTGIAAMEDTGSKVSDAWYSLDGRKLNAAPTRQGVYVNGGRKVVIK